MAEMFDDDRIQVSDLTEQLLAHPLYRAVADEVGLRRFMRAHVFCVWDFQSLLKALQRALSCVTVPWVPRGDPEGRRLINEVVLEEESDEAPGGGYLSHFEVYLDAMKACGADTAPIEGVIDAVEGGQDLTTVLSTRALPAGVAKFSGATFRIIASGEIHRMVAAFTYGREDIIPDMFRAFVRDLSARAPARWGAFMWYLERHIESDGERHGPISHRLLAKVCGGDERLWREAGETAREVIGARIELWDAILAEMETP
jgi:hypothetical protein